MFFSDVACERRQQFRAGGLPRTRLRRDGYVAELIEDRRSGSQLVHCVIQQEDSPEVLLYAQFRTFEAAWAWAGRELEEAFDESRHR